MSEWSDRIQQCIEDGYSVVNPNGLPLKCITGDGKLLECEHGDHKDYKFPIVVEYIGPVQQTDLDFLKDIFSYQNPTEQDVRDFYEEQHALIYTDGSVAITLHECTYAMFRVLDGSCLGGSLVAKGKHKLSEESLQKIRAFAK